MRLIGRTVMAGAALALMAAEAQADELAALKARIAALDARLAAIAAAPDVPQGYRLLAISDGELREAPGAPLSPRERAAYGGRATYIGVMPTADSPAGATISWSGYARAAAVYNGVDQTAHEEAYSLKDGAWVRDPAKDKEFSRDEDDKDIEGRAQLLVQGTTETSLGKVGVELEMRADFDGNGFGDLYAKVAWGYWSVTPELTLGGGYNQSIADITYGYDGSCTCYITDNADVDFNPGDTTYILLTYASGPVSLSVAVEDASLGEGKISSGMLGVAGEVVYSGDVFSGEIAGVWRDSNERQTGASQIWQVGAGGSVKLGSIGEVTAAAAVGEGPYQVQEQGTVVSGLPYDNTWWGASAFASINLNDNSHVELATGYKHREGDEAVYNGFSVTGVSYHTYAVLGGLYYSPVSQLTLGLEGEWYTTSIAADATKGNVKYAVDGDSNTLWADFVAVWSF